ncbi:Hypothetical predicted protein, partial [Marmota monax]
VIIIEKDKHSHFYNQRSDFRIEHSMLEELENKLINSRKTETLPVVRPSRPPGAPDASSVVEGSAAQRAGPQKILQKQSGSLASAQLRRPRSQTGGPGSTSQGPAAGARSATCPGCRLPDPSGRRTPEDTRTPVGPCAPPRSHLAALVGVGRRMSRESSERSAVRRVRRDLAASSSLEEALTGRYEPLGVVGQGSFAKVFLARHILTGTEVAVKVLRKGAGATLSWVLSELDIMKGLEHPHVVQLLEIVETPGTAYVVMEHMAGGQLGQHIPEVVGLWEDEARMLFGQVASAVGYCHAQGIAHRDVKADNVLLDAAGRAKLCDFGLACRFRAGEKLGLLCGTVAYWAPELHRREP